ncbi:MAG: GTP cyclohydrolase FolE2 [Deltaproteobacteria bacterium]|nr:GTP cyclohydrolase FolE2 [Deltaproteobacteria bacterium]
MLIDVQNSKDKRGIAIDKVGIKNLSYPIAVLDKKKSLQHTIAHINMYVDLPHYFKGTHMSRFLEVLNEYRGEISIVKFPDILRKIKHVLNANSASVEMEFPYFIEKTAPVSRKKSLMEYVCYYNGTIKNKVRNDKLEKVSDLKSDTFSAGIEESEESVIKIGVKVPINTLCPCSKEISKYGAHNQRGVVSVSVEFSKLIWFEDIIEDVESCASSPIYSLLKRSDERYLTEHAYENPRFVEDVVRCVAGILKENKDIKWYKVEAENFESIHNHNAYAIIEK